MKHGQAQYLNKQPDLNASIGEVRLGVDIAENIWNFGAGKGPKKSTVPPTLP